MDVCDELACRISDCSERTFKLVAQDNSETTVLLKELLATNKSLRTDENVQGNLLHIYQLQLTKLCSKIGHYFTTVATWKAHVESTLFLETTRYPK